eukprot:UN2366
MINTARTPGAASATHRGGVGLVHALVETGVHDERRRDVHVVAGLRHGNLSDSQGP